MPLCTYNRFSRLYRSAEQLRHGSGPLLSDRANIAIIARRLPPRGAGPSAASMTDPQAVIDLTADSPPLLARAGPSQISPRSRPQSTPASPHRSQRAPRTEATDHDEDISVVGFSLGTRRRSLSPSQPSIVEVRHAPPAQRIHEGIPPGPYTRRHRTRTSSQSRNELLERIGLLASRYVARSRTATTPQTLLRPYATSEGTDVPPLPGKSLSSASLQRGFNPKWTHPLPPRPGFSQNIVEPPIDLEGLLAGDQDAVAPLPDTTPICAGCRCALVLGGTGDTRIWALPCGHVIDGRCIARLGGASRKGAQQEGESSENSPHAFQCPIPHCKQRCHPEPGHRHSCIQVYI